MLKTSGSGARWNFTVRDNTASDTLYVLDTAAFTPTATATTRNVHAASGWGGSSYLGTRAAGPFTVLDVVYDAFTKILSASANQAFPARQLMWSVNNRPASGDPTTGAIGTSFFTQVAAGNRIYILGAADTDTDEYDRTVVAHEFVATTCKGLLARRQHRWHAQRRRQAGHARGFSKAGVTRVGELALGTQFTPDSGGAGQQSGYRVDLTAAPTVGDRGWYSERSVQYLIAWGTNASIELHAHLQRAGGNAHHAAGRRRAVEHPQLRVPPEARGAGPGRGHRHAPDEHVDHGDEPDRAGETNGGGVTEALPVYRTHTAALGVAQNYCLNDIAGQGDFEPNKLGAHIFIRFTLGTGGTRTISAATTTGGVVSDPDFHLYRSDGTEADFQSDAANLESTGAITLAAGTHIIALEDYSLTRGANAATNNGQRCFNVTIQ
ncbi:MAG: hypothetical protein U1F49_14310 [Rubrivivax sp.]